MNRGIRKVFIDSRYSADGRTFELHNAGIVLNPDSRMWFSEFTSTASWDTIDGTNNKLAVSDGAGPARRVITIPSGAHDIQSFRGALEVALNATAWGTYTVTLVSTGSSGSTYRSFLIENPSGFAILSGDPESTLSTIIAFPDGATTDTSHKSSFIDLRRTHSIYIAGSGIGDYSTYGVRGTRNILAKIPVTVGYASLVHWQGTASEHDSIRAGVNSISSITLELQDVAGVQLDLQDGSWSATLVFEN